MVQENERKRIAEALHDDVGNKLNILSLWVNNEDTWNNIKSKKIISQQVPELIEATRTISHSLYPVNLEKFGLLHTLDALMANIADSLSIQLILKYDYQPRAISFELQLYRIIQEFLSNVIKHAKATSMMIYIRDTKDVVTLILSDNGIGFIRDTKDVVTLILSDNGIGFDIDELQKGMGLQNIDSRIKSINGICKWKSIQNKGTRLLIKIE